MKRTKLPTRKQRAIRRTLWAVVLLLLVNHFLGVGLLLPIQAIRQTEEHEGVYPHGTVVARRWDPDLRWNKLLYLTANENAVSLGDASLEILGWSPGFGYAVDCTGEEPLYAAARFLSLDDGRIAYYFGRVDDPDIVTVEVSVQREDYEEDGEPFRVEVYHVTAEDGLLTHQNKRYFLLQEIAEWDWEDVNYWVVQGYDRNENLIYQKDIDQQSGGSY